MVNGDGTRVLLWRCLLRYGLLVAFSYAFWGVAHLLSWMPLGSELVQLFLVALWFLAGIFALLLETAMNRSSRAGRDYLYGRLSGTRLASTVLRQPLSPPESGK